MTDGAHGERAAEDEEEESSSSSGSATNPLTLPRLSADSLIKAARVYSVH